MAVDDKYTIALFHFDDGIEDESGKLWTAQNGATLDATQSKFGGASLYLNGINQHLTGLNNSDFDFGSGDFTIDWWEYRTSLAGGSAVFSRQPGQYPAIVIGQSDGTNLRFYSSGNGSTWNIVSPTTGKMGSIILNAWTHYAVVRANGYFYAFQNGNLITKTSQVTTALPAGSGTPLLGSYDNYYFPGYIDEFRISKGIARWTSNFTPSDAPYAPMPSPTNLTATAGNMHVLLYWTAVS